MACCPLGLRTLDDFPTARKQHELVRHGVQVGLAQDIEALLALSQHGVPVHGGRHDGKSLIDLAEQRHAKLIRNYLDQHTSEFAGLASCSEARKMCDRVHTSPNQCNRPQIQPTLRHENDIDKVDEHELQFGRNWARRIM
jgi:hypothetical protein